MNARCDHCGHPDLEPLYPVPDSRRAITVHLCPECALVQSLPRASAAGPKEVAVTAGAHWGNVRYGKGFRARHAITTLERLGALASARRVLDVGANRGAFIEALREEGRSERIVAVEPDTRVTEKLRAMEEVELIEKRIEEVALAPRTFDLIHCSHTLEHLDSPARVLRQLAGALADDGLLYIEVPDIAFIATPDIVEEWFIDKHLYHYSAETLAAQLAAAGLQPLEAVRGDGTNITVVARRTTPRPPRPAPADLAERSRHLLHRYRRNLAENRRHLREVARHLEQRARAGERILFWGAGRIFDALVTLGGFDPALATGLIDKALVHHIDRRHGLPLSPPEALPELAPDLVVITARQFADEIREEIDDILPGCPSLTFCALLEKN